MMTANEIRKAFLDFFESKKHVIVPSAPMVVKNDPTLLFINSGMAPFKDIFLGNQPIKYKRVADTQKCLRVSGKHNDLEEVGVDTYHHTMFEMLGNWSFGDYFKEEAIAWSWELLTEVYKLPKERLYVTVFEGDEKEKIPQSKIALACWKKIVPDNHIIFGNKKDNFWEMGDTGPCGPCSEIHFDSRSDEERARVPGEQLVNKDHPDVIEIWNNVFMQYNRLKDGSLEMLPMTHVDTGMGFERLVRVVQEKKSNYDTDIFQPLIQYIAQYAKINYGHSEKTDIAMRVMADHIRAIAFTIADGQLPSSVKAGYVIRRILRRAVRYAYTFLNIHEPFMHKLVPVLAAQFEQVFPELFAQQQFVMKVVMEEEISFLRTLETGIKKFEAYGNKDIDGNFAFELYDTYGFPKDLTELMAREKGFRVDLAAFDKNLQEQKNRSRNAAVVDTDDWVVVSDSDNVEFIGYDFLTCPTEIIKYRKIKTKTKTQYHLVLNRTPFYAESGGQVGDTGTLQFGDEIIEVVDTKRENNLNIHITDVLPRELNATYTATVNSRQRQATSSNHSATHLMHSALRLILGKHVAQKGSLVNSEYTRFDFSHFQKTTDKELLEIENMVNDKIRSNIALSEQRNVAIKDAMDMGAMALFGEKYGDFVRVITFDKNYSVELCGGTHVKSTGEIGFFKILSESSVAAGVRRIEALTAVHALSYVAQKMDELYQINMALKSPKDVVKAVESILDENHNLRQQVESLLHVQAGHLKTHLMANKKICGTASLICERIDLPSADAIKSLSFDIKNTEQNIVVLLGAVIDDKPHLSMIVSENLVAEKNINAITIMREIARDIQGGGGGQPFYANAGGKNKDGLQSALNKGQEIIIRLLNVTT